MVTLQRKGYRSKHLVTDIVLGVTDGLDMSLWCYVFASIIFSGVLTVFLPVGILICLLGWVLVSMTITLVSREPVHIANLDDQAVVIIGAIAVIMVAYMGEEAAGPRGLATILCIMALTSLGFALSCYLVGRYRLSRLLELLPFPVICGFMTSVGWLLIEAGFEVAADMTISAGMLGHLDTIDPALHLGLAIVAGAILTWCINTIDKFWLMPAAIILVAAVYYFFAWYFGLSHDDQVARGWLFNVTEPEGGVLSLLGMLSASDIDWSFITSVIPQMLTIVFLTVLYASMTITALKAQSREELSIAEEFQNVGVTNMLSALCCAPPSYTDVVASGMYREFGASTRWLQLTSGGVGILVILLGGAIISYLPKIVVSILVFLFAFQTLYDWAIRNARGFNFSDYLIIWMILGVVILVGFIQGILVGVVLTVLLFVIRYSRISALESRRTLNLVRSTVERSNQANEILSRHGDSIVIYGLRGFLFFGSANAILERIVQSELQGESSPRAILMDLGRVTGVDISALNTFVQVKSVCEANDVLLLYSGISDELSGKLVSLEAVSLDNDEPLLFSNNDLSLEYLEDLLLRDNSFVAADLNIRTILSGLLKEEEKIELMLSVLKKVDCSNGETLFRQGVEDDGFYIVEQGSMAAYIEDENGLSRRVRKFNPGALIGELSAYLGDRRRTATVKAETAAVVYHLDLQSRARLAEEDASLRLVLHEMIATVLAERVDFMNRRLVVDAG